MLGLIEMLRSDNINVLRKGTHFIFPKKRNQNKDKTRRGIGLKFAYRIVRVSRVKVRVRENGFHLAALAPLVPWFKATYISELRPHIVWYTPI